MKVASLISLKKKPGKIEPGFLEKSNTDITDEIVLMLRTQQAFNGCSKMLQTDVDITKKLSAR